MSSNVTTTFMKACNVAETAKNPMAYRTFHVFADFTTP